MANGNEGNNVVLARVKQADAFNVNAYEYYHGNGTFNSNRIMLSALTDTSPEIIPNLAATQGSIYYSKYYQKYIYFDTYPDSYVFARVADNIWGPWATETTNLYTATDVVSLIYAAVVQPKFEGPNGEWIVVGFTNANQQGMVNVVRPFFFSFFVE